jgi:hypothetical protein
MIQSAADAVGNLEGFEVGSGCQHTENAMGRSALGALPRAADDAAYG